MLSLLVVDDEPGIVRLLKLLFESAYNVLTAHSVTEAAEIAQTNHIDILISDIMLCPGTGFDVVSQTRKFHPDVKVILMTGFYDKKLPENFIVLQKPLSIDEIKDKVNKILNH